MTIDYVVKKKAIDLHLQGRGRNEIARILNSQKMRISEATITHLIQDWNRQQQKQEHNNSEPSSQLSGSGQVQYQASILQEEQQPSPSPSEPNDDATISTATPMNIVAGSSSLIARPGVELAASDSFVTIRRDGGPFSYLGMDKHDDSNTDFTAPIITKKEDDTKTDLSFHESSMLIQKGPKLPEEPKDSDINNDVEPDIDNHEQQNETTQTEEEFDDQPSFPLSAPEDQGPSVAIDWNPDAAWQKRLWNRIVEEKRQRGNELLLMEQQRQQLNEERQQIAQMMYNIDQKRQDLQARENKLIEVEELVPSAKKLKDIGIGFDQAIVWIDCIKEKAEIERISLREATWKLAQELRGYRELGGLSRAVQEKTQQLAMLNMVNEQQKQAIASLVDLRKAGFSEREIAELIALVGRWNARPGLDQGNGIGNSMVLDDKLIGIGH